MQRFAYIGTGWWGMELAKNSLALKDFIQIAGCCTLVDKEAAAFQAQFGGKRFPRYEDALADPEVDAVLLATPHSLHWTQIVDCRESEEERLRRKAAGTDGRDRAAGSQSHRGFASDARHRP